MNINQKIIIATSILVFYGLIMITSSSMIWAEFRFNDPYYFAKSQIIFIVLGFIVMYVAMKLDYSFYYKHANLILIITFILLILVLIPGIGVVRNGARSWFGIGGFGIQPSEAAKIMMVIFTAKYLSKHYGIMDKWRNMFPILGVLMACFALIMLQPDLGTGFVLVMTILGMLFIGGFKLSFYVGLMSVGGAMLAGLIAVAPYRVDRIAAFINPWRDPLGTGFQIIQSLYAIGPSGVLGRGLGNSIQKHFYLPEPQTDFIFSIIIEELGILGATGLVALFVYLIYQGVKIAVLQNDPFAKFLAFGLTFNLAFQTLLNMMVVVGLIPVTGVSLPFISYGGSSLLITMASIGILLNINKKTQT